MQVPLLDVNAQNLPLEAELTEAFTRVLRSGQFILGDEVARFESEVASFVGAEHAVGMSSGTDAILAALMALGIGPGDEVVCPSFTFFATAGCVSRTGATPVFADSCPVCFDLDPSSFESKVTPRTRAVIPVHLFGQSAAMDEIMAVAEKHGLAVIEDAAQAIGATYRGKRCGTLGTVGTFSFFPSKNLGGLGDGGMTVTRDPDLAEKLRVLCMHGSKPKYYHHTVGGNFRLDALQAALLGVKLARYETYTAARSANAAAYTDALAALPGVALADPASCSCSGGKPSGPDGARLVLPVALPHNGHIWNQFTLRVPGHGQRDALRTHLTAQGIGSEIYYPVPMHQQACFAELPEEARAGCPVAEQLASDCLSIPVYPELTAAQRDEVVGAIARFLDGGPPDAPMELDATGGSGIKKVTPEPAPDGAAVKIDAPSTESPAGGAPQAPRGATRKAARWLAESPLLRRGKASWAKNLERYQLPLSKLGKLETGAYLILNDYAEGKFPPTFADQAAAHDAEIYMSDNLPGWDADAFLAISRHKPFWFGPLGRRYLTSFVRVTDIFKACGFEPPAQIVEVGCGNGWMAEFFALYGFRVLGTTISPVDVAQAQNRVAALAAREVKFDLRYAVATMEGIAECPELPETTDAVLVYEALHHAYDWRKFIESAAAVVRPGGWLFILKEPNLCHTAISYRVAKLAGTHEVGFRPRQLTGHLKSHGFSEIKTFHPKLHGYLAHLWIAARRDG